MPYLSRSLIYLLIALAVGILAVGVDFQAITQTQVDLNYATAGELGPSVVPTKKAPMMVKSEAETSMLALSNIEGWQTYRNEEYGFEIQYPPDWVSIDGGPGDVVSGTQPSAGFMHRFREPNPPTSWGGFQLIVTPNPEHMNLLTWSSKNEPRTPMGDSLVDASSSIEFAGAPAIREAIFQFDSEGDDITIQKGDYMYDIAFDKSNGNDPHFATNEAVYAKILSTFKFTQ